jgi:hypothetical protein
MGAVLPLIHQKHSFLGTHHLTKANEKPSERIRFNYGENSWSVQIISNGILSQIESWRIMVSIPLHIPTIITMILMKTKSNQGITSKGGTKRNMKNTSKNTTPMDIITELEDLMRMETMTLI